MIIGIVGKKGVGKDTVADYLVSKYSFTKRAFADPVKEVCRLVFRLKDDQLQGDNKEVVDPRYSLSPRQMMQMVGTDMFRKMVDDNFWINYLKEWYETENYHHIVIPDVRFQNEVNMIKQLGGKVIKIVRPVESQGRHSLVDTHESETGVDKLEHIDVTVTNDKDLSSLCHTITNIITEGGRFIKN